MPEPSPADMGKTAEQKLADYLHVIWRRKWLIVIFVVVVTASITGATVWLATPKYESSAELLQRRSGLDKALLGADIFGQDINQPDRDLQTAAELMTSPQSVEAVNTRLAAELNGEDAAAFVKVSAVSKTDILRITASHPHPQTAADIANGFTTQYLTWRGEVDRQTLRSAATPIETQMAAFPPEQQESATYRLLQDKLETLKMMETLHTSDLEIVKTATAAVSPSYPKPVQTALISLISSLLVGVGIIFLVNHLDTRVRNIDDISAIIHKPILASIPKSRSNAAGTLATVAYPAGAAAEAFRLLKTNLGYVNPDKEIKSIMVTSMSPDEGKSTTVINLAITLARSGKRVAIMEADFRRPSMARYLGLDSSFGLTSVIADTHKLQDVMQMIHPEDLLVSNTIQELDLGARTNTAMPLTDTTVPLSCATSGPLPPNPGELASSDSLGNLIASAAKFADIVLVDAPPMGVVGDAAGIAGRVDGIILVVRMGSTSKKSLKTLQGLIDTMPSDTLGIVATNADLPGVYTSYQSEHHPAYKGHPSWISRVLDRKPFPAMLRLVDQARQRSD